MFLHDVNKVLVTGSSRGLGLAIAREMSNNHSVITHSRNSTSDYKADLGFPVELPLLDSVVCTAGEHISHDSCIIDQNDIDRIIKSNLLSVIHTCTAAIPMVRASNGSVVMFSSIKSQISNKSPLYALSKNWVRQYAERLIQEFPDMSIICFILSNVVSLDKTIYPKESWHHRSHSNVQHGHKTSSYLRAEDVAILVSKSISTKAKGIFNLTDNEGVCGLCESL